MELFGRRNTELRAALRGLPRYTSTVETSKHRFFVFLDDSILPDNKLVNIALDDAYHLGVLSSHVHVSWALATGGRLGVGNDPVYVKTTCFETFPFPAAKAEQQACIRDIAEQLDAHRKDRLSEHDGLTMTGMYNVLEKPRSCEELTAKERDIHEQGLVTVLKDLHDQLDRAVLDAYGWRYDLSDAEVLEQLVTLNAERAAEESRGQVRWLRPSYQNPEGATVQATAGMQAAKTLSKKLEKQSWPSNLPAQERALRGALGVLGEPVSTAEAAKLFSGARKDRVGEILETLASLGQVVRLEDNRYVR